jgi:hypothetical protein
VYLSIIFYQPKRKKMKVQSTNTEQLFIPVEALTPRAKHSTNTNFVEKKLFSQAPLNIQGEKEIKENV